MSNEARIIKVVAGYFGVPESRLCLDTLLSLISDHTLDGLDLHEILFLVEEEFDRNIDDDARPLPIPGAVTVRDFLRMVEPESVSS